MATTVFNRQVVDDPWTIIQLAPDESPATFAPPAAGGIFPLPLWLARKQEIISRYKRIGLWLAKADDMEAVADELHYFHVIAIDFPDLADGRAHAAARTLRERYGYHGEVRTIRCVENEIPGDAAPSLRQPALPPLIDLNGGLRTAVARKTLEVETRLAEIAQSAVPAIFASGNATRDLVLADIAVRSGLPVTIHAGTDGTGLLADWNDMEIWAYIHLRQLPYGAPRTAACRPADGRPVKLRLVQSCMARQ